MTGQSGTTDTEFKQPPVRLQKLLASAGLGSRRHCEQYIQSGRVTVDGREVRDLGTRVDPKHQQVRLDGELVKTEPRRYYLVNKPAGYLCTNRDPAGRRRVIDLLPESGPRLFSVGRLDESSEGLLLVTNDGELANRLAHPRFQVRRVYRVQVAGKPSRETLSKLRRGLRFSDGVFRVQGIRRERSRGKSTYLLLTLTEGRNREIRRMFARVGHKVMHLERIGFGPLKLGRLPRGRFRRLRTVELKAIRSLLEESDTPEAAASSKSRGKRRAGTQGKDRTRRPPHIARRRTSRKRAEV